MKFILVNHRTPRGNRACTECSRTLGPGYVRDVITLKGYCGYDCYRRCHLGAIAFGYLARPDFGADIKDVIPFGFENMLSAASYGFQIGAASISWIDPTAHTGESRMARRPLRVEVGGVVVVEATCQSCWW